MQFAAPECVTLHGILGEALDANRTGRLSTFIVDKESPAIAIFAPDNVAENDRGDWYGEHAGKWLLAATRAARRANDAELLHRAECVADWLVEHQADDGYLGNYPPVRRFMRKQPTRPYSWNGEPSVRTWDIWTHSYLILGLLELTKATGTQTYLDAARRIGDLCYKTIVDGDISIIELGNHFGLSASVLIDPAVELYFATGDTSFLTLAKRILDQLEAEPANRLLSAALAGRNSAEIATGKAYQLLWNMVGVAKLYRATGEPHYLDAVLNVWRSVREDHLTLGGGPWGGVGSRSREVFNPPGTFDPEAYVETCSTMAWIQLNRELLAILGEGRFAEEIERAAYNDLLGAQADDGEDWCYYSFANGRRVHTTYWRCCKSSGSMALEELPPMAFAVTPTGEAVVNLLGPSTARLDVPGVGEVMIEVRTRYPFEGRIEIDVVSAGGPVPLLVRIPSWARMSTMAIGASGYMRFEATGAIQIDLPMAPTLHRRSTKNVQQSLAPDGVLVESEVLRRDYAAVTRGPVVYASGLIDGFKPVETVHWTGLKVDGCGAEALELLSPDRSPIRLEPYYRAGGRHHGAWRVTWLRLAPEEAE